MEWYLLDFREIEVSVVRVKKQAPRRDLYGSCQAKKRGRHVTLLL
jgi:hypothetical protein